MKMETTPSEKDRRVFLLEAQVLTEFKHPHGAYSLGGGIGVRTDGM